MSGNIQWRIFCSTENLWVYIWSDNAPTTCPNNASHVVNLDSVQQTNIEKEVKSFTNLNSIINTSILTRVLLFQYNTTLLGTLRRVKCLAYCDVTVSSFNILLYDRTNVVLLLTSTLTNTNEDNIIDLGVIETAPSNEVTLELSTQILTGIGNIYVIDVSFFAS
jgi:hypothetical protein